MLAILRSFTLIKKFSKRWFSCESAWSAEVWAKASDDNDNPEEVKRISAAGGKRSEKSRAVWTIDVLEEVWGRKYWNLRKTQDGIILHIRLGLDS
jgi:hypothetical protein